MALDAEMSIRPVLTNRTNVDADGDEPMDAAGPSCSERKIPIENPSQVSKKRPRHLISRDVFFNSSCDSSDDEDASACGRPQKVSGRRDVFGLKQRSMVSVSGSFTRYECKYIFSITVQHSS